MQIVEWYDELVRLTDSPVARLNRAVAVGEADGPRAGLAALAGLDPALPRHAAVAAYLHERDGDPVDGGTALRRSRPIGAQPPRTRPSDATGRTAQRATAWWSGGRRPFTDRIGQSAPRRWMVGPCHLGPGSRRGPDSLACGADRGSGRGRGRHESPNSSSWEADSSRPPRCPRDCNSSPVASPSHRSPRHCVGCLLEPHRHQCHRRRRLEHWPHPGVLLLGDSPRQQPAGEIAELSLLVFRGSRRCRHPPRHAYAGNDTPRRRCPSSPGDCSESPLSSERLWPARSVGPSASGHTTSAPLQRRSI